VNKKEEVKRLQVARDQRKEEYRTSTPSARAREAEAAGDMSSEAGREWPRLNVAGAASLCGVNHSMGPHLEGRK